MKATMHRLSKKEQIKLVREAYNSLYVLNNIRMEPLRDNLCREILNEEKGHRKFVQGTYNLSLNDAAKFFLVRTIAEYLEKGCHLAVKDYLVIRKTNYMAASIVANYSDECRKALSEFNMQDLIDLDYCDLIA